MVQGTRRAILLRSDGEDGNGQADDAFVDEARTRINETPSDDFLDTGHDDLFGDQTELSDIELNVPKVNDDSGDAMANPFQDEHAGSESQDEFDQFEDWADQDNLDQTDPPAESEFGHFEMTDPGVHDQASPGHPSEPLQDGGGDFRLTDSNGMGLSLEVESDGDRFDVDSDGFGEESPDLSLQSNLLEPSNEAESGNTAKANLAEEGLEAEQDLGSFGESLSLGAAPGEEDPESRDGHPGEFSVSGPGDSFSVDAPTMGMDGSLGSEFDLSPRDAEVQEVQAGNGGFSDPEALGLHDLENQLNQEFSSGFGEEGFDGDKPGFDLTDREEPARNVGGGQGEGLGVEAENSSDSALSLATPPPVLPKKMDFGQVYGRIVQGFTGKKEKAAPSFAAGSQSVLKILLALVGFVAIFLLSISLVLTEEDMRLLAEELQIVDELEQAGVLPVQVQVQPFEFPVRDLPPQSAGEEPVKPLLPDSMHSPTENEAFFKRIFDAVQSGDAEAALRALQAKPEQPFRMRYDLDMASLASARFSLLLLQPDRASRLLEDRCLHHAKELSAEICVHYVRALVSMDDFVAAEKMLTQLETSRDRERFAEELRILRHALNSAAQPTPSSLAEDVASFLQTPPLDYEWDRQESIWVLKNIARLEAVRWRDLAQILFQFRREEFNQLLVKDPQQKAKIQSGVGLTHFLDYLALRFGYEPLGFEHGSRLLPAADHRVGVVVQALSANMTGKGELQSQALHYIRGKEPFSEVERLIAVSSALQERKLGQTSHLLNTNTKLILEGEFGYEWKLVAAHYAVDANNMRLAEKMYRVFTVLKSKSGREFLDSFDFWYALAKLELYLEQDPSGSLAQAESFSTSEREQGLIQSIRVEWMARNGNAKRINVSQLVQRFPWHFRLLSAAIIASGYAGRDPSRYIEMQNMVSTSGLTLSREKNLVTDHTLRQLLLRI